MSIPEASGKSTGSSARLILKKRKEPQGWRQEGRQERLLRP